MQHQFFQLSAFVRGQCGSLLSFQQDTETGILGGVYLKVRQCQNLDIGQCVQICRRFSFL